MRLPMVMSCDLYVVARSIVYKGTLKIHDSELIVTLQL